MAQVPPESSPYTINSADHHVLEENIKTRPSGSCEDSVICDGTNDTVLELLPWEDVLYRSLFPCLDMLDLFRLRATCTAAQSCVTGYFFCCRRVDLTRISTRFTAIAFHIVAKNNTQLQVLILRNAKTWLTDPILVPVLDTCRKLIKLDLTNCMGLGNASLQKLAISCHGLQELLLRDCHWVGVEAINVIAMNCRQLHRIDLTGCWEVNDEAVITLAMFCKELKYLSIAKIYGLTDNSVSCIAKNCTKLFHMNMQGCWRVTDDAVRLLGEYCHELRGLQVRECREVTEISLARLRAKGIKVDVPRHPYRLNPNMAEYLEGLKHVKLQI